MKNILFLLIVFCNSVFSQEKTEEAKLKFGILSGMQLSSTKFGAYLLGEINHNKHLYYLGIKTPVAATNLYGYFPVGVIAGYGYCLLQNEQWKTNILLDTQWLNSETRNQIKPTHYFDFTLNYQLTFSKWKKIHLSSSFGYGVFVKHFYRNDSNVWSNNTGISGLIRLGVKYNFLH